MKPLTVTVAGIGAWAPGFESWPALRSALASGCDTAAASGPARRPVALLLPAAERRRVPDGVAVALEVAREAIAAAASTTPVDSATLASVFASANGELAIVDYLCSTLAADPLSMSPTRFHHSVHNAAAGYWGIATPSVGPSTSIAAGDDSFAVGLLEAATQVAAEDRPVLLVVFDTPAVGLLRDTNANTTLFGAALLLTPVGRGDEALQLSIALDATTADAPRAGAATGGLAASSAAARAVVLLDAIARAVDGTVRYALRPASTMSVRIRGVQ